MNDILFNDDDDKLPWGSSRYDDGGGGRLQEKSNDEDTMNSKVKDCMPPYVMMDFKDHGKQKNLVVVVGLPTGVTHYNTTDTDISVGSPEDKLNIKII